MQPGLLRVMIAFDWVIKDWGPPEGPVQLHWDHPDMLKTCEILTYAQVSVFGMGCWHSLCCFWGYEKW